MNLVCEKPVNLFGIELVLPCSPFGSRSSIAGEVLRTESSSDHLELNQCSASSVLLHFSFPFPFVPYCYFRSMEIDPFVAKQCFTKIGSISD